jgi:hypothetical protein
MACLLVCQTITDFGSQSSDARSPASFIGVAKILSYSDVGETRCFHPLVADRFKSSVSQFAAIETRHQPVPD